MICAAEFKVVFIVAVFAILCHWCKAAHLFGPSSLIVAGEGI